MLYCDLFCKSPFIICYSHRGMWWGRCEANAKIWGMILLHVKMSIPCFLALPLKGCIQFLSLESGLVLIILIKWSINDILWHLKQGYKNLSSFFPGLSEHSLEDLWAIIQNVTVTLWILLIGAIWADSVEPSRPSVPAKAKKPIRQTILDLLV